MILEKHHQLVIGKANKELLKLYIHCCLLTLSLMYIQNLETKKQVS